MQKGEISKNVRIVQYFLNIDADGIFGDNTESAIKAWQELNQLPTTGIMNKDMMDSTIKPTIMEKELPHIKLANSLVGEAVELDVDGDGSSDNRGLLVDEFIKVCFPSFDFDDKEKKGYAWCACFISWCMEKTYTNFEFKSALAREWITYASTRSDNNQITDIKQLRRNNVYIGGWVKESGYGHVYFVDPFKSIVNSKQNKVVTIEGNTNVAGSREGDGIFMKGRDLNNTVLYGFEI
jgi:peptidoglycan hydrolase-like protein with peptidoglycan-binding domain